MSAAASLNERTQSIGNRLRRFSSKYAHPHSFRSASGNSNHNTNTYSANDNSSPNTSGNGNDNANSNFNTNANVNATATTTTTATASNTPPVTVRSGRSRRRRSSFFGTLSLHNENDSSGPHASSEAEDGGPLTHINTSPGHLPASNPIQTGISLIRSLSRSRSRHGPRRPRDSSRGRLGFRSTSSSRTSERAADDADEDNNVADVGAPATPAVLPSTTMAAEIDNEINTRLTEISLHSQSEGQLQQQQQQQQNTEPEQQQRSPQEQSSNEASSSNTPITEGAAGPSKSNTKSTIRFFPYQDPHNPTRPSLSFSTISRTVTDDDSLISVGRYSERESKDTGIHAVGFKSKVVSRKHCEFSHIKDSWFIRDVGSSSGTFLNHIRLSQPNVESKPYPVRDGDLVQLGIDFRGGEEMIFRCVRMRIECNRMWQKKANRYNKNTAALISNLSKSTAESEGCRECSICLGSIIRPYQNLFMASCAHVWHYKCISRLLHGSSYPLFQCPNCRAWSDLTSDPDDFAEDSATEDAEAEERNKEMGEQGQTQEQGQVGEQDNAASSRGTAEHAEPSPHTPLDAETRTTAGVAPEAGSSSRSRPESAPRDAPHPEAESDARGGSGSRNDLGLFGVLLDAHSDQNVERREYSSSETGGSEQNDTQPSSAGRGSSDSPPEGEHQSASTAPRVPDIRPVSRRRRSHDDDAPPLETSPFETHTPSNDLGALGLGSRTTSGNEALPAVSAS